MGRIRRCDSRCHYSKGKRCACVCGGYFHGAAGLVNREALRKAASEADTDLLLQEHGFKPGQTAYLEQPRLPLEEEGTLR
jgi:hypothetical protein